ncbi:hypothetical protein [Geosporobacter ferrireducens]|uniref:Zinc ribbon domain-containing protein n=1 Tax=Geosporobacter ferrireducens TaxID=1424294 RepID=A0A1D8GE64_9FIRM|nr:hypothetical protein [Geosporobacter ferrireducens]AOT69185.1 hypothetical protein Gferi_06170 [Geosporobacter ferrireducens]MTI56862.1 hydrogenase maturation nickel metallochaperone HypA [Geosporobacter ferrireducens]
MNGRRLILFTLLFILVIIFIYNYLFTPLYFQYGGRMGMGMHGRMGINSTYKYYVDFRYILLIAIIIAGMLLFDFLQSQSTVNKCRRCGFEIESDLWKICPICGASLKGNRGDVK